MLEETEYEDSSILMNRLNNSVKNFVVNDVAIDENQIKSYKNLTFNTLFQDKLLLVNIISNGLPNSLFKQIKNVTPFKDHDWADFLNVSLKTIQRHDKDENYQFKPIHSEKILELTEVTILGHEVFDSKEQFYIWLNTPSYALGNRKPNELLKDSYGKDLVMSELYNIEYGNFA